MGAVARDYSDAARAVDALQDQRLVASLIKKAYDDIVVSGRWTYRNFVRETEEQIFDDAQLPCIDVRSWLYYLFFRLRDWVHWRHISVEVACSRNRDSLWARCIHRVGRRFAPPW